MERSCFFPVVPSLYLEIRQNEASTLNLDTLAIIKAGNPLDTLAFIKTSSNQYKIPLDIKSDTTRLEFYLKKQSTPIQLSIGYSRRLSIVTPECGYVTFFDNLQLTSNGFEGGGRVMKSTVDTIKTTHLRVVLSR